MCYCCYADILPKNGYNRSNEDDDDDDDDNDDDDDGDDDDDDDGQTQYQQPSKLSFLTFADAIQQQVPNRTKENNENNNNFSHVSNIDHIFPFFQATEDDWKRVSRLQTTTTTATTTTKEANNDTVNDDPQISTTTTTFPNNNSSNNTKRSSTTKRKISSNKSDDNNSEIHRFLPEYHSTPDGVASNTCRPVKNNLLAVRFLPAPPKPCRSEPGAAYYWLHRDRADALEFRHEEDRESSANRQEKPPPGFSSLFRFLQRGKSHRQQGFTELSTARPYGSTAGQRDRNGDKSSASTAADVAGSRCPTSHFSETFGSSSCAMPRSSLVVKNICFSEEGNREESLMKSTTDARVAAASRQTGDASAETTSALKTTTL